MMSEVLTALSPVFVAFTTGIMAVILAKVNARVKRADEQDEHLKSIQKNQESITKNLSLITDLTEGHAKLTAELARQGRGMRILLRSSMQADHQRLMNQGYISSHQLRDFEEAYDVYHQEGGNGTATRWLEELKELPIRDIDPIIPKLDIKSKIDKGGEYQ